MQKLLFFLLIISSVCVADIKKSPMVYRYWDFGSSEKRDKYQFELLNSILEKTTRDYGKYELVKHDFEGFSREVDIFGLYKGDMKPVGQAFVKAIQPKLFGK